MKIDDVITLEEFEEALAEYAKSLEEAKNESIDESLFNNNRSKEKD